MENIIITKKSSAKTNFLIKTLLTCVSLAVFIASPDNAGFFPGSSFVSHLTYSFCHANIFHLAANLVVLWSLRNRICLCASLFAAVLASFLPTYVSQPTVGLSGVIFAAIGIMWGKTGRFLTPVALLCLSSFSRCSCLESTAYFTSMHTSLVLSSDVLLLNIHTFHTFEVI